MLSLLEIETSSVFYCSRLGFFDMKDQGAMMPGGEPGDKSSEVGLIDYLDWKREYEASDKSGKLGFLFCAAFGVEDRSIRSMEDDLMADSLIRNYYCYDDFVARI